MGRIFQDAKNTYGGVVRFNGGVAVTIGEGAGARWGRGADRGGIGGGQGRLALQEISYVADRQLSYFYDLTSLDVYQVPSRLTVQGQLNRIVGPAKDMMSAYATIGDLCKMNVVAFDFAGCMCDASNQAEVLMKNSKMVMTQVGLTRVSGAMSVQNFAIMEQAMFSATDLEYTDSDAGADHCLFGK